MLNHRCKVIYKGIKEAQVVTSALVRIKLILFCLVIFSKVEFRTNYIYMPTKNALITTVFVQSVPLNIILYSHVSNFILISSFFCNIYLKIVYMCLLFIINS